MLSLMTYSFLQMEASYSGAFLVLWAFFLAILSWNADLPMMGLVILALSSAGAILPYGESRVMLPLLFLSDILLNNVINFSYSPLEFYASTLFSCLTFIVCGVERMVGEISGIFWNVVMCVTFGLVAFLFFFIDIVFLFGAIVFVFSGLLFFLVLRSTLEEDESVLVSSLAGFYICDALTNNNVNEEEVLHKVSSALVVSETHIVGRGVLLSAICMVVLLFFASRLCQKPGVKNSQISSLCEVGVSRITVAYWSLFVCVFLCMHTAVGLLLGENASMWLLKYVASSSHRILALITWATVIPVLVLCVDRFTVNLSKVVRRKLFHFIAVFLFTPVAIVDPSFFSLSLSIALGLTILVELARFYGVYGSLAISRFISNHIDHRDSIGGAVRTHIYLIFAFGFSMALNYRYKRPRFATGTLHIISISIDIIPGIVALGIVDAFAAVVGSTCFLPQSKTLGHYLVNWLFTAKANFSVTHKTTTGTLGGFFCGVVFWIFILLLTTGTLITGGAGYSFILIFVSSLVECFFDGVDNLQVPLLVNAAANTLFALIYGNCVKVLMDK